MYVLFLLGFRFGDRDWDADGMSIAGQELDLDNTKIGDGGGGKVGSCSFVLWLLVFGVWLLYECQREAYLGKKACRAEILRWEGKWCMSRRLVQLRITHPSQPTFCTFEQILEYLYFPLFEPLIQLITDPNRTLYPPFDSPPSASQVAQLRYPHMIRLFLTLDLSS